MLVRRSPAGHLALARAACSAAPSPAAFLPPRLPAFLPPASTNQNPRRREIKDERDSLFPKACDFAGSGGGARGLEEELVQVLVDPAAAVLPTCSAPTPAARRASSRTATCRTSSSKKSAPPSTSSGPSTGATMTSATVSIHSPPFDLAYKLANTSYVSSFFGIYC